MTEKTFRWYNNCEKDGFLRHSGPFRGDIPQNLYKGDYLWLKRK